MADRSAATREEARIKALDRAAQARADRRQPACAATERRRESLSRDAAAGLGHDGGMATRPPARSVKISEDERTGWSSDRPRRDGAPPRPANLTVHCRVLAPADRLRYSPGSLLSSPAPRRAERDALPRAPDRGPRLRCSRSTRCARCSPGASPSEEMRAARAEELLRGRRVQAPGEPRDRRARRRRPRRRRARAVRAHGRRAQAPAPPDPARDRARPGRRGGPTRRSTSCAARSTPASSAPRASRPRCASAAAPPSRSSGSSSARRRAKTTDRAAPSGHVATRRSASRHSADTGSGEFQRTGRSADAPHHAPHGARSSRDARSPALARRRSRRASAPLDRRPARRWPRRG